MSAAPELEESAPALRLVVLRLPVTRGECAAVARPCPWVTCQHHLAGAESCALDVADRGGATLEEVAEALGTTRERVRQIEEKAIRKALAVWTELEPDALVEARDRW